MATPWKHPDSGTYYLRERVPAAVVDHAKGRTIAISFDGLSHQAKVGGWVKLSLRTKDATTAKERYREAAAALQEHYRLIEQELSTGPVRLTQRQLEALAGEYFRDQTQRHQENPGDSDEWDAARSALQDMGETAAGLERLHGEDADQMLQRRGLSVDADCRGDLLEAMHRAYVMFAEGQERRASGDYSPDRRAERFPEFPEGEAQRQEPTARESTDMPEVSLSDLFDLWAKEHQKAGGPDKTVKDFRHKLESLRRFLRHDDGASVTQRQIIDWCDHLQDEGGLSAKTVGDKYLTAARAVFRVGIEKHRIVSDPTTGIKVRKPKRIKARPSGFTNDEAKAILIAAMKAPSTLGGMAEKNKLAIRWTPWLGAYTGARITELTQLRREDFVTEAGISCIRITPEAGRVKNGQYRIVPLHPHLIEMGILDFVSSQPEGHLFATSGDTLEETHKRCENVGKKVSGWVREAAGVTDRRVQPTHGWRHRFKTLATVADIAPEYADMIQGHARGDAAEVYREADVSALYREIRKLPRDLPPDFSSTVD